MYQLLPSSEPCACTEVATAAVDVRSVEMATESEVGIPKEVPGPVLVVLTTDAIVPWLSRLFRMTMGIG